MSNISKDFVTKNGIVIKGNNIVTSSTNQSNALQADGGIAVAKNLLVGTTATIYGQTLIKNTAESLSAQTGALIVDGGVGVAGDLYVEGTLYGVVFGTITTASNISNGDPGQLVYQITTGTTGFHGPGNPGDILTSSGTSGPYYQSTANIYVRNSVNAEKLYGGTAGSLVIQTSTNQTYFLSIGANNSILTSNGNQPSWNLNPTIGGDLTILGNLTVQGTSTIVDSTVTNIVDPIFTIGGGPGGTAPNFDDQKDRGIAFIWTGTQAGLDTDRVGFFGFDHSTGYFTFITSASIIHEVVSPEGGTTRGAIDVNFAGGAAGAIPIQSTTDQTTYIAPGTIDGYVLTWNNALSTASWNSIAGTTVDNANTATNLRDGESGSIPYQVEPGITSFIGTGTEGSLLQMGANTATFVATASIYVSRSVYSDNIYGGATDQIPYQTAPNTTNFSSNFTFNGSTLTVSEVYITAATSATSSMTGALRVVGGVGIEGDLYVGGQIFLDGATLDNIFGTTATFFDVISTGTVFATDILAEVITATNYLHVTTTTNDIASYGRDLDRTREALGVVGAIHTLGDVAVGGVLYAGMNDAGDVAGQNPHNKTIDGIFIANSMQAGGTYDNIASTATQIIDDFDKDTYSTAKYTVQVTSSGEVHSQEIMLIHNGTNVYMSQYGIITSSGQLGTFSGTITGASVQLNFTPNTSTSMTVNIVRQSIITGLQAYG
jgi:hypothetical protein